jgi:hypothetical protein
VGTLWELCGNNGEHFGNVVGTLWEQWGTLWERCGNSMGTMENTLGMLWELHGNKGEHCIDPFKNVFRILILSLLCIIHCTNNVYYTTLYMPCIVQYSIHGLYISMESKVLEVTLTYILFIHLPLDKDYGTIGS